MFKGGLLRSFRSSSNPQYLPTSDSPTTPLMPLDDAAQSRGSLNSVSEVPPSEDVFGRDDAFSIAESSSSRGAPSIMSSRTESLPPSYAEHDNLPRPRSRPMSSSTHSSSSSSGSSSSSSSSQDPEDAAEQRRRRARRRQGDTTFGGLQAISEANASSSNLSVHSSFAPSLFGVNSSYAKRMEETGRLRRLQSQQVLAPTDSKEPRTPESDILSPPSSAAGPSRSRPRPESEVLPPYISPTDITFEVPTPTEPAPEPEPPITPPDPPADPPTDPEALLIIALRDLAEERSTARQLAAEHEEEKAALLARVDASEKATDDLALTLAAQARQLAEARSELSTTRGALSALAQEKRGWQDKADAMHHKLQRAERAMRCLDHMTRAKLAARQAAQTHAIRRTQKVIAMELAPRVEVIGAVEALNEEILQLANIFVESLERTRIPSSEDNTLRARSVLGDGVTAMMQTQAAGRDNGFRFLLMQVALEVFMTSWCSAIIDGFYPKQESFADLLLEMSSQSLVNASRRGHVPRIECGNPIQVVQVHAATTMAQKFPQWVDEITDDLATILLVGGLKMKSQRASMFSSKFLGLVTLAYDLRAALAEKDLAGGLDLYMVAPDTPFRAKWMDEAHAAQTHVSDLDVEPIAGTCGLGLSRDVSHSPQYWGRSVDAKPSMVLKPKVVLLRVLQENL